MTLGAGVALGLRGARGFFAGFSPSSSPLAALRLRFLVGVAMGLPFSSTAGALEPPVLVSESINFV